MGDNGFHEWHKPQTLAQGSEQPEIRTSDRHVIGFIAWDNKTYDGLGSPVGFSGKSEDAAIADLKKQLIERGLYANIE